MKEFIPKSSPLKHCSSGCSDSETTPEEGQKEQSVFRTESQKPFKGPEDLCTGEVQYALLFPPNDIAHYSGGHVRFQPGARTAWHCHPAGQHIIVTSGVGLTGTRDGKIIRIKAGDVVWSPPGTEHWHGASPDEPMAHLAITGVHDHKNVIFKEKVSDEQYLGK